MSSPAATWRVFVALELPESVRGPLRLALTELQRAVPPRAVRWVRPENIHLTLRFLGGVSPETIPDLLACLKPAAGAVSVFPLRLGEPGCFPSVRSPRVLWVGLAGDLERLAELRKRVGEASAGWGEREDQSFHPHLTLGRVNTRHRTELAAIAQAMNRLCLQASEAWTVTSLSVVRSELAPGGSIYTRLAEISLAS